MKTQFTSSIDPHDTICLYVRKGEFDIPAYLNIGFPCPTFKNSILVHHLSKNYLLIEALEDEEVMNVGGRMLKAIANHKLDNALIIPPQDMLDLTPFLMGIELSAYRFNHYFSTPKDLAPKTISILGDDTSEDAHKAAKSITDGVAFCRDLISEPSNVLTPEHFKNQLIEKLKPLGVKITVLDERAILKRGMNALHGVAKGSRKPPFVVIMHWQGSKEEPVAIVGKGVCFDTGGISLKPANRMHEMKYDMGGAGCVSGLMYALAARKAKSNVIGVVGLVENMPDGNAQNPGDVVTSMSGQTIEVLNTDAEGRLVLADALTLVQQDYQPKAIVDLATLTGAVVVSLGSHHAGLFSNNNTLAKSLVKAGTDTQEKLWQLPLGKEYDKEIDSSIADMQNIGSGGAGSITAAQFLQRFIENDTPWAHLDIAGVTWSDKPKAISPKGATGFGVRLLNHWIQMHYEEKV